jgi:hypothetical protein
VDHDLFRLIRSLVIGTIYGFYDYIALIGLGLARGFVPGSLHLIRLLLRVERRVRGSVALMVTLIAAAIVIAWNPVDILRAFPAVSGEKSETGMAVILDGAAFVITAFIAIDLSTRLFALLIWPLTTGRALWTIRMLRVGVASAMFAATAILGMFVLALSLLSISRESRLLDPYRDYLRFFFWSVFVAASLWVWPAVTPHARRVTFQLVGYIRARTRKRLPERVRRFAVRRSPLIGDEG